MRKNPVNGFLCEIINLFIFSVRQDVLRISKVNLLLQLCDCLSHANSQNLLWTDKLHYPPTKLFTFLQSVTQQYSYKWSTQLLQYIVWLSFPYQLLEQNSLWTDTWVKVHFPPTKCLQSVTVNYNWEPGWSNPQMLRLAHITWKYSSFRSCYRFLAPVNCILIIF